MPNFKMPMKRFIALVATLGLGLLAAACGGRSVPPPDVAAEDPIVMSPPPMAVVRPTDIPLPPRHTLDLERTVMVGSDSDWLGRASMSVPVEPIGVWDFYRREMPHQGWAEISASQSPNRVLFYQRGNRVAIIEMRPGRNSSRVDVWMNPRQPEPPVAAAPPAPVSSSEPPAVEAPAQEAAEPSRPDTIEDVKLPPLPWQ